MKVKEPVFLSRAQVLELHLRCVAEQGGLEGWRDPGILDTALMQPEAAYYFRGSDPSAIAAAYAFHIAQEQPFLDGNQRAAIAAALTFFEANGVDCSRFNDSRLYDAMLAVAEKRLDQPGLAAVFRAQLSA